MALQPDDRLYFIHLPKTGGTTLISLLDARFGVNEIFPAQLWRELAKVPQEQIQHYRLYRGHFGGAGLLPFLPKPPVTATQVRHPISYAISRYRFALRNPDVQDHKIIRELGLDFSGFIRHEETQHQVNNPQTHALALTLDYKAAEGMLLADQPTFANMQQWVMAHRVQHDDNAALAKAIERINQCAWVGLMEHFDRSVAMLNYAFGWAPLQKVQPLMVAPPHSAFRVSHDDMELLLELNQADLELYRHTRSVFEAQWSSMIDWLSRLLRRSEGTTRDLEHDANLRHRLLDRHYAQAIGSRRPPKRRRIRLDFSEPLPGTGWHVRERAPADNTLFRWTGPGPISTMDLPLQTDQDLLVRFRVLHAPAADVIDGLSLRANGKQVQLDPIDPNETFVRNYRAVISRSCLDSTRPFVRLEWIVPRTCSLHSTDPNNPDHRLVGVAINWVEVMSLAAEDIAADDTPHLLASTQ